MKIGTIHPYDSELRLMTLKSLFHQLTDKIILSPPQLLSLSWGVSASAWTITHTLWLVSSVPPKIISVTPPPPAPVELPWFPELRFTAVTTTSLVPACLRSHSNYNCFKTGPKHWPILSYNLHSTPTIQCQFWFSSVQGCFLKSVFFIEPWAQTPDMDKLFFLIPPKMSDI